MFDETRLHVILLMTLNVPPPACKSVAGVFPLNEVGTNDAVVANKLRTSAGVKLSDARADTNKAVAPAK
jgi:hypothetical protein